MSQMKALYETVARDPVLQAKFITILQESERIGLEEIEQKMVALSKDAGFDITLEEMQHYLQEMTPKADGELSDTELDLVAGGKGQGATTAAAGVATSIGLAIVTMGLSIPACIPQFVAGIELESFFNRGL